MKPSNALPIATSNTSLSYQIGVLSKYARVDEF